MAPQPSYPADKTGAGYNYELPDEIEQQVKQLVEGAAGQARLGLPTRDYYLLQGEKYDAIRTAYRNYIVELGKLAGLTDPEGRADRILALETSLSKDQWTPEQRRDPVATHNPMTHAQLMKLAPQFDWPETLRSVGLANAQKVDVAEPSAVAAAGKRIADVPLSTWKEYLTFRFISGSRELSAQGVR